MRRFNSHQKGASWQSAVWIRVGHGGAEPVRTPGEALDKLDHRWPAKRGKDYCFARSCCLAALRRELDPALAKAAFIHASVEAKMLD
jgi:hypothetical protein